MVWTSSKLKTPTVCKTRQEKTISNKKHLEYAKNFYHSLLRRYTIYKWTKDLSRHFTNDDLWMAKKTYELMLIIIIQREMQI